MKSTDQDPLSVERLLSEVQFSPPPEFRDRLHTRLKHQLTLMNPEPIADSRPRRNGSLNGRIHRNWRWITASIATVCLVVAITIGMVPTVRAQVLSLLQFFEVQLSPERKSVVASSFTPLVPEEIPSQFLQYFSLNQQDGGPAYVEMRYFNQDSFAVIYETAAQPGEVLPQGEPVYIGDHPATMIQKLNGIVFLAAQAPQPWRALANGGGGGNYDDADGKPPQKLFYTEAIQLNWVQSGLYIELLSNLPIEEAFRLAVSLQPAMQP